MFWRLGRVKISSQSNGKKKNKTKQNKTKQNKTKQKNDWSSQRKQSYKEEKGKDNENLQDICKNQQGLPCNRKKKEFAKIYYLWVTVITPDICQILQEKPNGKLKMVLFRLKK